MVVGVTGVYHTLLAEVSFWRAFQHVQSRSRLTTRNTRLAFRVVGLFTSQRETSVASHFRFMFSMGFRYPLRGRSGDKQVKNRFKRVCKPMRIYFFTDLLCKNEPP